MQDRLTEQQVDEKISELKENIKKHTFKQVKLDTSIYTGYQLAEYKNKKEKNRKRNKMQKNSRKTNRGK